MVAVVAHVRAHDMSAATPVIATAKVGEARVDCVDPLMNLVRVIDPKLETQEYQNVGRSLDSANLALC